jgi:hypothetical protein
VQAQGVPAGRHRCGDVKKKMLKFLIFQYRFDILTVAELLEMSFSSVAEQQYVVWEIPVKFSFEGVDICAENGSV